MMLQNMVKLKDKERGRLAKLVQDYLDKGGEIEQKGFRRVTVDDVKNSKSWHQQSKEKYLNMHG